MREFVVERLWKNVGYGTLIKLISGVGTLGLYAVLTRLLSPSGFGAFTLIVTVVMLAVTVGVWGQDIQAVRVVAESVSRGSRRSLVGGSGRVFLIGVIGGLVVSAAVGLFGGPLLDVLFDLQLQAVSTWWIGLWIVGAVVVRITAEAIRGLHRVGLAGFFTVGGSGVGVAVSAVLIAIGLEKLLFGGTWSVAGVVKTASMTTLLTAGAAVLLFVLLAKRQVGDPAGGDGGELQVGVRELLRRGTPLLISALTLFLLNQGDLWILGATASEETVGLYGAAVRLVAVSAVPLAIANSVVQPAIAELNSRGEHGTLEKLLRGSATVAGVPALIVLVLFMVGGGYLLDLLYGDFYSQAALIVAVLSVGKVFNVISGSAELTLKLTGYERDVMRISVGVTAAVLGVGYLVASRYEAVGLAAVMSAGFVVYNVLRIWLVKIRLGVRPYITFSLGNVRRWYDEMVDAA